MPRGKEKRADNSRAFAKGFRVVFPKYRVEVRIAWSKADNRVVSVVFETVCDMFCLEFWWQ